MKELLLTSFGLLLLVGLIGVPILLIVTLGRLRRLEGRMERMEREARGVPQRTKPDLVARLQTSVAREPSPTEAQGDWSYPKTGAPAEKQEPRPAKPATPQPAREPLEEPPQKPAQEEAPAPLKPAVPPASAHAGAKPTSEPIRWEEWIGVRGAAIVGGTILAIAGILLFRHALQEGWIGPKARVGLGAGAGLICILLAQILRKNKYGFAPSALEGGGLVALYASTWAADRLYDLIPHWASFCCMTVVTSLACFLALRSNALLTAVIGLFGGFATPLLLSSSLENPAQLFGYIAVLDVALLAVGSKRRWPSLGLLALFGTFLLQAFWVLRHMGSAGIALGALIAGLFALLFALSGKWLGGSEESRTQTSLQAMSILFPFLFAVYFASSFQLGETTDFYSTAGLLVLLQTAACVLATRDNQRWLPVASSAGAMGVTGIVWLRNVEGGPGVPGWTLCGIVALLILIPLAFAETRARLGRGEASKPTRFSWTDGGAGGLLVSTVLALLFSGVSLMVADRVESDPQHLAILSLALGVILYALRREIHAAIASALALGLGIVMALRHGITFGGLNRTSDLLSGPIAELQGPLLLLPAALLLTFTWGRPESEGPRSWSAVFYLAPVLLALPFAFQAERALVEWWPRLTVLLAGLILALASSRLRSTFLFAASAAVTWLLLTYWAMTPRGLGAPVASLMYVGLGALLFSLWPHVKIRGREARLETWFTASAVCPLFALSSIRSLEKMEATHPVTTAALFGIVLLLPGLAAGWLRSRKEGSENAGRALPWMCASMALLVAVAISVRIDIQPLATTLALWAVGMAIVRRGVPYSSGVAFLSATSMALASTILLARLVEGEVFLRSDSFALNGFTFAYLVPASAGVIGSALLFRAARSETDASVDSKLTAALPALCAVLLVFLWINLAIWNQYETRQYLTIRLERIQSRDLTLSISWAVYAMGLLGLGTYLRAGALRWTSLLVLFAAIGKAFLWDLGELEALWRVGSLAALAFSLIAVSLFYQRFVFGKHEEALSDSESAPLLPPAGDS